MLPTACHMLPALTCSSSTFRGKCPVGIRAYLSCSLAHLGDILPHVSHCLVQHTTWVFQLTNCMQRCTNQRSLRQRQSQDLRTGVSARLLLPCWFAPFAAFSALHSKLRHACLMCWADHTDRAPAIAIRSGHEFARHAQGSAAT